jgi:protoheme IX farnesyltransferase
MIRSLRALDERYTTRASRVALLHKLTLLTAVLTYFLVIVGNIVRITGSGLGCPDWPFCYGYLLPSANSKAIIEMAHRYFAGIVSILIGAIALLHFRWRLHERFFKLCTLTLAVLAVQILLGALTVWSLLHEWSVALHLLCGMATLGCTVALHLELRFVDAPATPSNKPTRALRRTLTTTAALLFLLLGTGGLMSGSGAAMACGVQFPLCHGGWWPNGSPLTFNHWLHRASALLVTLLVFNAVRSIFAATKRGATLGVLHKPALVLLIGIVAQATIGALIVLLHRPDPIPTLHNAVGALTWMSALTLALVAHRAPIFVPERAARTNPLLAWQQTIHDYVALTKPRVISLLLFTTFAAMFITPAGAPPWYLVLWTMIGGYLMAGGANAVNMAYDIDIDLQMSRTKLRPTAGGRVSARKAYVFGFALGTLSLLIFVLFVNWLAALFALLGFFYYTVVYTRWLKRSTWQNIVIGGGAGAVPPLIGYAAASSSISLGAVLLFVIIFYWTPPHFWALALMKRKDYAAAGVPMLPVVAGENETTRQMLLYAILMVVFTLLLVPIRAMGGVYLIGAVVLGAIFLFKSWQVNQDHSIANALSLYKFSLLYLALLFAVMMIDRLAAA